MSRQGVCLSPTHSVAFGRPLFSGFVYSYPFSSLSSFWPFFCSCLFLTPAHTDITHIMNRSNECLLLCWILLLVLLLLLKQSSLFLLLLPVLLLLMLLGAVAGAADATTASAAGFGAAVSFNAAAAAGGDVL